MSKNKYKQTKVDAIVEETKVDAIVETVNVFALVKMYREVGRVKTADVHPSEVENCLRDGWQIVVE